jgi:hypothetical protein
MKDLDTAPCISPYQRSEMPEDKGPDKTPKENWQGFLLFMDNFAKKNFQQVSSRLCR